MQHVFLHRGPSRIFWFLLGAGAATWWHYTAAMRDHRAQFFPCVMCIRDPPQTPTGRSQDHDSERLVHLQKRATETAADLSESTLDSIISGAESLKVKLGQLRAERERLEAEKNAAQPAA